jgi:hypothetical protein
MHRPAESNVLSAERYVAARKPGVNTSLNNTIGIHLSELDPIEAVLPNAENNRTASKSCPSIIASENTRTSEKLKKSTAVLHKLNSIIFVRRRMLYDRPALDARGNVRVGLKHIRKYNLDFLCEIRE